MKSHKRPIPVLERWFTLSTKEQRIALAKAADTSVPTLMQLRDGFRRASSGAAITIERASRAFVKSGLPLLKREDLAAGCGACEFARKCRNAG